MSSFDPSKRVAVLRKDIDRAQFWFNVKVYAKTLVVVGFFWAVVMWVMLTYWI
jgi:hypothetical protein